MASTLKDLARSYMRRHGLPPEMEQNLVKEALHHHILSSLSDAGLTERVVFQGGTSLRLCYQGTRYSEDLDFVCGRGGEYVNEIEFERVVDQAMDVLAKSLSKSLGLNQDQIRCKPPKNAESLRGENVAVSAWQIAVPIDGAPSTPSSRVKIEFANVPSHDSRPMSIQAPADLIQAPAVIILVESPTEILADKIIALINRPYLKYRDIWDVNFIQSRLGHQVNRTLLWDLVQRKLTDYRIADMDEIRSKLEERVAQLKTDETLAGYRGEISRFIPSQMMKQTLDTNLHVYMLEESSNLLQEAERHIFAAPEGKMTP